MNQMDTHQVPNEHETSLLDLVSILLRRRRLILVSTFAGALVALVVALRTPLEYTATTSFLPNVGEQQGGLSGVSSLAQQFGLSIPRSGGASRSPEFYDDLLQSREILDGLVKSGVEVVTAAGVTRVDLVEHFEIGGETPQERNTWTRRRLAGDVISVAINRETAVVTVSVRTDDPGLSAAIGRKLLDLISAFDSETRQSQATAEREFAGERLGQLQRELTVAENALLAFEIENRQWSGSPQLTIDYDRLQRRVVMRQELVTAMAQAHEQARIDEVRNVPVFTIIDQPESPAVPNRRGRLRTLFMGLVIGLMVGFGLAVMREFGERAKSEQSEAYGEFQEALKDVKGNLFGLRQHR
jgi:uncharacterized protein involved in exopolysaccharide biosynthesis